MNYKVITKLEYFGSQLTHTPVGYVTSDTDADTITSTYFAPFSNWVDANKAALEAGTIDLSTYFSSNPECYQVGWSTNDLGSLSIPLITDINNIT